MPTYTYNQVKQHNDNGECWLIINGEVYDVTTFTNHPGGYGKLKSAAASGGVATDAFQRVRDHRSNRARARMAEYYKGDINMPTVPVGTTYRQPRVELIQVLPEEERNAPVKIKSGILILILMLAAIAKSFTIIVIILAVAYAFGFYTIEN